VAPCEGPPWQAAGRAAPARARALQRPPPPRRARRTPHARSRARQGAARARERRRRLDPGRRMGAAVRCPQGMARRGQIRAVGLMGVDALSWVRGASFVSHDQGIHSHGMGLHGCLYSQATAAEHEATKRSIYQLADRQQAEHQ